MYLEVYLLGNAVSRQADKQYQLLQKGSYLQ